MEPYALNSLASTHVNDKPTAGVWGAFSILANFDFCQDAFLSVLVFIHWFNCGVVQALFASGETQEQTQQSLEDH